MSASAMSRHARLLAACTGQSRSAALHQTAQLARGEVVLPAAAESAQEVFEWWLFHRCAWPDAPTVAPFGFTSVAPTSSGLTLVAEDRPSHVRSLVQAFLPTYFENQVDGVPGLRVSRDRHDGSLLLRMAGTSARVALRGISAATWKRAVGDWRKGLKEGVDHLWETSPDEITAQERDLLTWFPESPANERPYWLGSALLRRAHVFTAAGWPVCVTAWITGGDSVDRWKFEIEFLPGHRFDHQRLVTLLTNPLVGLPLTAEVACGCGREEDSVCRVNLKGDGVQPNSVQLLLRHCELETVEGWEARWPGKSARFGLPGRRLTRLTTHLPSTGSPHQGNRPDSATTLSRAILVTARNCRRQQPGGSSQQEERCLMQRQPRSRVQPCSRSSWTASSPLQGSRPRGPCTSRPPGRRPTGACGRPARRSVLSRDQRPGSRSTATPTSARS